MSDVMIQVEVAYALPEKQLIIPLTVKKGTTMFDAVVQSGIADKFEGLDIVPGHRAIRPEPAAVQDQMRDRRVNVL